MDEYDIDINALAEVVNFKMDNDLGNVTITDEVIEKVIKSIGYDYENPTPITAEPFICPENGVISTSGQLDNIYFDLKINNQKVVVLGDSATGSTYNSITVPVSKGDSVTGFAGLDAGKSYFFKMIIKK